MKALANKTALVTGASAPKGIGRAIALRLAQEGARIVVTDIAGKCLIGDVEYDRLCLLNALVNDIENLGGTAIATPADVSDAEEITACVNAARNEFGSLDILVNNAGSLAGSNNFLDTTPEQWETSFKVNLLGPMMAAQAAIPLMRDAGGGRIINIGSTGSLGAEAGFGAYTTMKHGLIGLTKTIAAEFGVYGILCNAVCPGYINTDMHEAANNRLAKENGESVAATKTRRYADVALRRSGEPAEVAEAVLYLAGPQSAYVTGIALPVAGGVPFGI